MRGRAAVTLSAAGGRTRLARLAQAGSARAFLPRVHGDRPEVVFLNTAGGVTAGDRLEQAVALGPGAAAVATTQTAERAYRAASGPGDDGLIATRLTLGPGAALDWLPQALILFEGSRTERRLEVEMAADARLLMVETVVLGRAAMGETLARARLGDHRRVRRAGRLVHAESLAVTPAALMRAGGRAVLGGARAAATLTLIAPGAGDALARLRAALPGEGDAVRAAASAMEDRLVARFLAPDAWPLGRALGAAVAALTGRALPRVWQG